MKGSLREKKLKKEKKEQQKELIRKLRWNKEIEEEREETRQDSGEKTLLLELCYDDNKLYYALKSILIKNPELLVGKEHIKSAESARKYKSEGKLVNAKKHFRIAGSIALYKENEKYAKKYISEIKKLLDPDKDKKIIEIYEFILKKENLIRAMKKAKEFYKKKLEK
jgi:hypothetical protein